MTDPNEPTCQSEADRLAQTVDPRVLAQARLAAIVECSDDAIVSKSLEGIITSWNKGAERIFGWVADEVIGQPITILIPPDRLDEEPVILGRIRAGERVDHFETVRQTKDGRLIDVSVTISPVCDERGGIIGVSKIARDITHQKRYQEELAAAKAAAEEAREIAEAASRAKDHFLSVLSHELRTPLTPVLGAITLIEHDPSVPPHVIEQIDMIRRNVEAEARLVDDLLDLTRIAHGKIRLHFEVVDAHAALRDAAATLQGQIDGKSLSLTLSLWAKQHHIWVDPDRFQQIVLNVLANAVKFTPENGSITIRTNDRPDAIEIEVIDTGIGIEPEVIPRLFDAFEQGDRGITRAYGGLGLGLSIVKSLVDLHQGKVTVNSAGSGRGSTLTLQLPTVSATAAPPPASPMTSRTGGRHRILLVEDHRDTRQVLVRLLSGLGCIVTSVASVKEAIEAAESQRFDLLVSDIGLPDGTGMEVMRHVAAQHGVKGIALSGYGQDEDLRRSREAGFVTHLTKPVNLHALQECILKLTA